MNKRNTEKQIHSIPPFWRPDSEQLILGSFPSVKSREQRFYYDIPGIAFGVLRPRYLTALRRPGWKKK